MTIGYVRRLQESPLSVLSLLQVRVRLFTTSLLGGSDVGHAAYMKCIITNIITL